uniref:DUF4345 domain-containing protein n=1 Tax=Candidatus Kentrum sp. TC TaxID=2126339 RepID=A0A450Y848_9GAMM|nr:MAG: hypothetical protein BECKTC1821D_GA0114238_100222 [Candidatus Kentron sp. TC]VFK40859.1 MAG: hypothetical protein BECKTC1821E_GA0114239_100819 [Candidatus Kentron sp. TC]VFK53700.1 MAG: hypothetical protein BECKTC1821F_GA0114240_100319 [Candidatus Kentron sp. TC]
MKGMKIILFSYAIIYFLGFVLTILPWPMLTESFVLSGVQPPVEDMLNMFWVRMSGVAFGLATIFFVILARNPLGYGAMLPFAAYGQICAGFSYLALGVLYEFPLTILIAAIEGCFLLGTGVLLLILLKKAMR